MRNDSPIITESRLLLPDLAVFREAIAFKLRGAMAVAKLMPVAMLTTVPLHGREDFPLFLTRSDCAGYEFYNKANIAHSLPLLFKVSNRIASGLKSGFGDDVSCRHQSRLSGITDPFLQRSIKLRVKSKRAKSSLSKALLSLSISPNSANGANDCAISRIERDILSLKQKRSDINMSDLVGKLTGNEVASLVRRAMMQRGIGINDFLDTFETARTTAQTSDGRPDHKIRMEAAKIEMTIAGIYIPATGGVIAGSDDMKSAVDTLKVEAIEGSNVISITDGDGKKLTGVEALRFTLIEAQRSQNKLGFDDEATSINLKEEDLKRTFDRLSFVETYEGIVAPVSNADGEWSKNDPT